MASDKADDLRLPMTVVQRIIKGSVPDGTNVSKEARTAIARAAAVFVLHATNFANENATSSNRKTITAADVLHGLKELECDELVEPVTQALEAWREEQKARKDAKKPRLDEAANNDENENNDDDQNDNEPTGKSPEPQVNGTSSPKSTGDEDDRPSSNGSATGSE